MAGNLYSYIVMDFMIMMDRNDEKARLDLISVSEVGTATKVGREFSGDPREHRNEINLYLISRNVGRNDHTLLSDSAQCLVCSTFDPCCLIHHCPLANGRLSNSKIESYSLTFNHQSIVKVPNWVYPIPPFLLKL